MYPGVLAASMREYVDATLELTRSVNKFSLQFELGWKLLSRTSFPGNARHADVDWGRPAVTTICSRIGRVVV